MKSDIQIARDIELQRIEQIAESIDLPVEQLEPYGRYTAKVPLSCIDEEKVKKGNLILVEKPLSPSDWLWDSTISGRRQS